MIYELKIALRFLKSGKTQTIFIILGIAIGVSVQIFLGSLITSLQQSLVDRTIGNSSHITITSKEDDTTMALSQTSTYETLLRGNYSSLDKGISNWSIIVEELEKDDNLKAVSPTIQGTGLVQSSGKDKSVQIKGIQFDRADEIYAVSSNMVSGNADAFGNTILIGTTLAEDLGISEGGFFNLLLPSGESVQMMVGGIFDLKNEVVNGSLVFMDLNRAQKIFEKGSSISLIEAQIKDPFMADEVAMAWQSKLGDVKIINWKEQNKQLLSALSSQSSSSYTIQFFVIMAVTFGISSVLAVSVVQKSKEIGILKAMGATKKSASRIFLLQGLILGGLGSFAGCGMGILLLTVFQFFNRGEGSFIINYQLSSILIIVMISILAGATASVIPARRSANLNPMEAIKNG